MTKLAQALRSQSTAATISSGRLSRLFGCSFIISLKRTAAFHGFHLESGHSAFGHFPPPGCLAPFPCRSDRVSSCPKAAVPEPIAARRAI